MALRTQPRAGDSALVLQDRADLPQPEWPSFLGKTGTVLGVQKGTGDLLLKFKRSAARISYPRDHLAWRANG